MRLPSPNVVKIRTMNDSLMRPKGAEWLGLDVRSHRVIDADRAEVAFVARLRDSVRVVRMHERSRFVRESGRWCYVDGDQF